MGIEETLSQILKELQEIRKELAPKNTSVIPEAAQEPKYYTVKQWAATQNWPSEHGMRAIIFNQKPYRAEHCFKKMGSRVLIDREAFYKWLETNPKYKLSVEKYHCNG